MRVRVVANSLAVSDEPLVNIGYLHPRWQMLSMGVALYGLSSPRLKRDSAMRDLLGSSAARSGGCTPRWVFWTSARCGSVR